MLHKRLLRLPRLLRRKLRVARRHLSVRLARKRRVSELAADEATCSSRTVKKRLLPDEQDNAAVSGAGLEEDADLSKASKPTHSSASSIWLSELVPDAILPPQAKLRSPEPAVELSRLKAVKALRHKLRMLCSRNSTAVPLLAFERWHARAMLHENRMQKRRTEPLLPAVEGCEDPGIVRDLERAYMESETASAVARDFNAAACAAAQRLRETGDDKHPSMDARTGVHAVFKKDSVDLSLGKGGKPFFSLNTLHYEKLSCLHQRNAVSEDREEDLQLFHARLFCMLVCMDSLGGSGYQAALPPSAFRLLHQRLGVSLECFASPLNCTLPAFCSLLPHVDAAFGSRGSFFEIWPSEGSFEMNPPFVPEIMTAAVEHAEELLKNSKGPMSFAIFVPAWKKVACWDQLGRSQWLRGKIIEIAAHEHAFCDGAQHKAASHYRPSSFDTAVAFLQNDAGARRWPVTPQFLDDLRASVAATGERAVPSLNRWENRGSSMGGRASKGKHKGKDKGKGGAKGKAKGKHKGKGDGKDKGKGKGRGWGTDQ